MVFPDAHFFNCASGSIHTLLPIVFNKIYNLHLKYWQDQEENNFENIQLEDDQFTNICFECGIQFPYYVYNWDFLKKKYFNPRNEETFKQNYQMIFYKNIPKNANSFDLIMNNILRIPNTDSFSIICVLYCLSHPLLQSIASLTSIIDASRIDNYYTLDDSIKRGIAMILRDKKFFNFKTSHLGSLKIRSLYYRILKNFEQ